MLDCHLATLNNKDVEKNSDAQQLSDAILASGKEQPEAQLFATDFRLSKFNGT
jgi:hypothetical protein